MKTARRPFLALFLCLALAANLIAPFASASPLLVEICSGHRTVLIPAEGSADPGTCETCLVCWTGIIPPGSTASAASSVYLVIQASVLPRVVRPAPMPRRLARAPPFLTV